MKLINADKYKKDIEHYRNTICYQRNVTMDDCMRILDKQEDVLGQHIEWLKEQIDLLKDIQDYFRYGMLKAFELCLKKYEESENKE